MWCNCGSQSRKQVRLANIACNLPLMPPKESSKLESQIFSKSFTDSGKRLRLLADHLSAGVGRYWHVLIVLLSIGYFCDASFRASRKLFWFDEIFTIYVSRLPDLSSLWTVLKAGVDFNPPLLYILTKLSNSLLGESLLSTRLPEILGFWIFCVCLYWFVSVRSSASCGFISFLFPMVTMAYWYAYEARPYAIELGCCGIALVCWQSAAVRASGRVGWLLGLGAGLVGTLWSHGYAFVVFVPIVLGELMRTASRRRVDWPVWVTIVVSSGAVIVLVPLSLALRSILIPATVNHASLAGLITIYITYLKPAAYIGIGWLILMCVERRTAPIQAAVSGRRPRSYEMVALLSFLAIPAFQYLIAKVTGAPPVARYSICWIAGPAALLGLASARHPLVAVGTLCILAAQIGTNALKFASSPILIEPSVGYPISTSVPAFEERYRWMETADKTLPIALLDGFDFLPTAYYAPPDLVSRMTYAMPSKSDLLGFFYARLRTCCHSRLDLPMPISGFVAAHDSFLAYGGPNDLSSLNDFRKEGATVTVQNISPDHFLVSVQYLNRPAKAPPGVQK